MRYSLFLFFSSLVIVLQCNAMGKKKTTYSGFGRWLSPNKSETEFRGGLTKGTKVSIDIKPNQYFRKLQNKFSSLSKKKKDRLAILAMYGPYRASFEFLETFGLKGGYTLRKPYRSWGTEYIYILNNTENLISLQHIMVMYFENDGKIEGPLVMKHWRQDWAYQKPKAFFYRASGRFSNQSLGRVSGSWVQSVYHVDDSPRYSNVGRWSHQPGVSTFDAEASYRPLPRRELTVRKDYNSLLGKNIISVIAQGWVHEQHNLKVNYNKKVSRVIAKENGFNRYQRVKDFDFKEGDRFFEKTEAFWALVRSYWSRKIEEKKSFALKRKVYDKLMFEGLFQYADDLYRNKKKFSKADANEVIQKIIDPYIVN